MDISDYIFLYSTDYFYYSQEIQRTTSGFYAILESTPKTKYTYSDDPKCGTNFSSKSAVQMLSCIFLFFLTLDCWCFGAFPHPILFRYYDSDYPESIYGHGYYYYQKLWRFYSCSNWGGGIRE
ncbi:hypothetical protein D3C86_1733600 [compost metagenome]